MTVKFIITVFLTCFVSGMSSGLAAETTAMDIIAAPKKKLKTDVVLLAAPVSLRSPSAGRTVDALEKLPEEMPPDWKVVVFRIEQVMKGKFKIVKAKDPSLWSQMQEAASEKKLLKLVTLDFERPAKDEEEKGTISMAVSDPFASFGVKEGEDIPRQRYKISLALFQKDPDSYVLMKTEKL